MTDRTINAGDWVIVCDGRKALILENVGDEVFPNLRMRETREQENPPTNEQGTDRPGRVHDSSSTARSAVGQTDWHDQAEREFCADLAGWLDRAVQKKKTNKLIMVAAPRALGMIREAYTSGLEHAISEEIAKDYVNLPIYDIEKLLMPNKPA